MITINTNTTEYFRSITTKYVVHVHGLVQDCGNSSAYALELLQSCTKPSMYKKKLQMVCNASAIFVYIQYNMDKNLSRKANTQIISMT